MPHSLPPAPPAIIQSSRSEDIPLTASTNAPAQNNSQFAIRNSQFNRVQAPTVPLGQWSSIGDVAPLSPIAIPNSVDIAPSLPNSSPPNDTKSAELLGPAVGIAYPTMPDATRVLAPPNPSDPDTPPAPTQGFVGTPSDDFLEQAQSFSISSNSVTRKLNTSLPQLPQFPQLPLIPTPWGPRVPQLPQLSSPPSAFIFRFTVVQPQPSTLSILAQQQRQPVVQPPPPPSVPTPKPPSPTPGQNSPVTPKPPSLTPGQNSPPVTERIIELSSQRQEYDTQRHIVTAEGNVVLRTGGVVLTANRLQASLQNLIAVATGNVIVTRGQQVLRGEQLTYNFVQDSGDILYARGDVDLPATKTDFSGTLPNDVTTGGLLQQSPDQRALLEQPLQQVTSPGGIGLSFGGGRYVNQAPPKKGGVIRRLRFQAERINFYPGGWQATNVQITNDPFSPPELELRANTATLTKQTPTQSLIVTTQPRLVFDQGFTLPIPKREATVGRGERRVNTFPIQIGYDATDKGGLFVERGFTLINSQKFTLTTAPEILAQRVGSSGGVGSIFGLSTRLNGTLGPRTVLEGRADANGFGTNELENRSRVRVALRQLIGSLNAPYTLTLETSYRDRIFNGSLGYQTVQSSLGAILASPVIPLGKSGITLSYQFSVRQILSNTDRLSLLRPIRSDNLIPLVRLQGAFSLNRGYLLFSGKGLPATASQGLRYTPTPVVPYLVAFGGLQGVSSYYTSNDSQNSLTATIGLQGQFGHFSRPYLDYTNFLLSYSQGLVAGSSPFLFDRYADSQVLSAGLIQQIYGPFRFGVETILNLGTGKEISTDYFLDYSRRTYGIILRVNPVLGLGSINIRISDFNFLGGTNAFSGSNIVPVVNGVEQENYQNY